MNILITGAAGFIGSHLSERFLKLGHSVTALDNFDPFYNRVYKDANLKSCLSSQNFIFHEGDIVNIDKIISAKNSPVDLVIHLAAKAGIRPSIENPEGYIRTNILGTFHILEWMKKYGCKKMIFASSSSVYGNNDKIPFSETDPVDEPISPYAFTKKSCEQLNYNYHYLYNLSIINLRFFTVYGPRQRPDLAIHKFFDLIYNNKPIQIFGDGTTGRDYTFIDDIIDGIYSSAERLITKGEIYETINLGNSKPVLLNDLVNKIEKVCGKNVVRNYTTMQQGDVDRTFADIASAREKLNFDPSTTLEDGLNKFKLWYESR